MGNALTYHNTSILLLIALFFLEHLYIFFWNNIDDGNYITNVKIGVHLPVFFLSLQLLSGFWHSVAGSPILTKGFLPPEHTNPMPPITMLI